MQSPKLWGRKKVVCAVDDSGLGACPTVRKNPFTNANIQPDMKNSALNRECVAQPATSLMPIEHPDGHRPFAPLAGRVKPGATAAQVAGSLATICLEINAVLSPIVGVRGVAALHSHSHHRCAASHAWLASLRDAPTINAGCETLVALLAQREPGEALSGGEAYLQTFHALLTSLLGPSLTERLLSTAWPPTISDPAAQHLSL